MEFMKMLMIQLCLTISADHQTALASMAYNHMENTLTEILEAIKRGLTFMENEVGSVNLDAIIGTRIVEGQLAVLLDRWDSRGLSSVGLHTYEWLSELRHQADRVSRAATVFIRNQQPKYFNKIGRIIDYGFWRLDYATRSIDRSEASTPIATGEAMHESDSDDCLAELFGTSGGARASQPCRVSQRCWNRMTSRGYRLYSLSHEVFYLEIGIVSHCFTGEVGRVPDRLNAVFCSNMLLEAEQTARNNFPTDKQDLFMEQAALCGVLGYKDFFRPSWLGVILSWQHPRFGCWADSNRTSTRVKREEKLLEHGCLCHRTAVGLAALVGYARFVIESIRESARVNHPTHFHHLPPF